MSEVDDEQEYEDDEDEGPSDAERFRAAASRLTSRCTAKGIAVKIDDDEPEEQLVTVSMPNGKVTRDVMLASADEIESLLAVPFERFVFLGAYDAIASYSDGTIECLVRPLDNRPPRAFFRALQGSAPASQDIQKVPPIELPISNGVKVSIGYRSAEFGALVLYRPFPVTLRISGVAIAQHDQTVALLERISGAVFFQVDVLTGVPMIPVRRRTRPPIRGRNSGGPVDLRFPEMEYDSAPLSLYWYARGAVGMPLLQFLAYYQVLEFYFPVYSQAEAQRRVQQILKDPTFRPDREVDLNRVLVAARAAASGGFGDERSQLRAVINECVDADDLRSFLAEDEERKRFFSSKTKSLTAHRLPIDNPTIDLRNDVAERVYEIRCKIVHTKSGSRDGEVELLLPFSAEAEMLYRDIELLGYLAAKVLVAGSSPIRLS